MLRELKIEGFKLLKDIQISPHTGFNVITGETGAGKSLIIGALKFLLGERGGDELFAKGSDTVKVSASFGVPKTSSAKVKLIEEGVIEEGEEEIHLERWKERDGKSRIFVGGRRANLPAVKVIRDTMIDFLEQHQASRLTERSALEVLDSIGTAGHQSIISKVQESFSKYTKLREELLQREQHIRELAEKRDLMEFQLKELADSNLVSGEINELTQELQILSSASDLRENAFRAMLLLEGDDTEQVGAQGLLSEAIQMIEPLAAIDPEWASKVAELRSSERTLRETARELGSKADSIHDDPQRLSEVESRIALIEKLKRKYHRNLDELIELRNKLSMDVEDIQSGDEDIAKLKSEVEKALAEWKKSASELSDSRKKLAKQVEKELKRHLADLELVNSKVVFKFDSYPDTSISAKGIDKVEMMLSTNPAEELRPLSVVASGGEATRITLALKALWAEREGVPVLVLDEGDIGIGGDTAYRVGEKFKELAESHQLIVVSHLAQVAAYADRHFRVEKTESKKDSGISIDQLDEKERLGEIARMIGGTRDIQKSIALAQSLIAANKICQRGARK